MSVARFEGVKRRPSAHFLPKLPKGASDVTRPLKVGPDTMGVQPPQVGERRTPYGKGLQPPADRPLSTRRRGQIGLRRNHPGDGSRDRRLRDHLPPLEEAIRRDEPRGSQMPQGAPRRKGVGHRRPQGGEQGKLLSPARREKAVTHVQKTFSLSERRACRTIDHPRSTQRYSGQRPGIDQALCTRMSQLSRENPRYGYRRVWALLRREGWEVNKKRLHRLWREAGREVPKKQHKSRRLAGNSENGLTRKRAEYACHVWSYDFTMDQTEDVRRLKLMPVVEEYTRECLALPTQRSITAEEVIQTLAYLFAERGATKYLRSDNGPEFIAQAVKDWLASSGVQTLYIEPGSPWENCEYVFN